MNHTAELIAIYVSPGATVLPQSFPSVRALAGRGLEGDRYAAKSGTFSAVPGTGREVTLIESEVLADFARDGGKALGGAEARRNLLTRGVRLNDLVGREFRIGAVRLRGCRLCEPCAHLARLTGLAVLPALVGRGGLRAEFLDGGVLSVGDPVVI